MARFLLSLKHWQLFLVSFVAPMLIQGVTTTLLFSGSTPNLSLFIVGFAVSTLLMMGVLFAWYWAASTTLPRLLPETVKAYPNRIRFALLLPILYAVAVMALIAGFIHQPDINPSWFALIAPLHLLSMGCIFYSVYQVAHVLKAAEEQRPVGFSEVVADFLLLWLFPVGVWLIQPRINKLVAS
ncbi:hypothetical protein [Solirubrum puertoriconensis]|uniref:Uncharacterized protein n=1 Tax=Solirubrum puertoriconensis TaxID=1751427 RepID=A0A9X0HMI4_SOLP1|nr:hypothetical protein [Solirubrum puertoriconensis]KUG08679.1 hypothetical protein ASU33_11080 [Solirubrum puertoriconensis]